jgi:desumoylating isopeptidase 1
MEVQLYVYDLSRGLARQFSGPFLGTQIDAVYHTSTVVGGMEYFFGRGIQQAYPGTTHHGQPMEIIPMGTTQLDSETIQDYLRSLRNVYTAEVRRSIA